jgi:hypothetical protein
VETSSGLFKFRTRTVTLHSAAATLPHV